MPKIKKVEPLFLPLQKPKKVAIYARVSKDTGQLIHSIFAQIDYYSDMIKKNPKWEYVGVYADYGITGTSISKRQEFQRMIADCDMGKIDIILTKSISRFARNTVDLLNAVRHLKSLGIEVWFEREQIHSCSKDGELMLSLLASFAQEESYSISENIKWGIRKRFEAGESREVNKHVLGYQYDEKQKKYVIIPQEAEIIRWIFNLCLEGISLRKIAKTLNEEGFVTINGCKFTEASLNTIIHNEIYMGDIRHQKYFVKDPIMKKKVLNRGQLPQYYIQDCHEAILDRETYKKVQKRIKHKSDKMNLRYCFTGSIYCDICRNYYTRKKIIVKGKTYIYWICSSKKKREIVCKSTNFREEELEQICVQVLEIDEFNKTIFKNRINKITILENGDLKFHFTEGRITIKQR